MTVVIANEEEMKDPRKIGELISKNKIEMIQVTPSRLRILLDTCPECFLNLKDILVGGEQFPQDLADRLFAATTARVFNLYGPTETTIWSTIKELKPAEKVTIGKPMANTQCYILDPWMNVQPIGVWGELYIGGEGLAIGYHNRPDLTAERFIENPYKPGTRIYRTGDIVRWTEDGEIEFKGRNDRQIKLNGYRIELEEIETALRKQEGIADAAVVIQAKNGISFLVAFYQSVAEISNMALRKQLRQALPDYMIPAQFIRLEQFPQTPNGKLDIKALEKMAEDINNSQMEDVIYQETELSSRIADIWKSVLGLDRISLKDNFFDIGGSSMYALQVMMRMEDEFGMRPQFADFIHYTLGQFAEEYEKKLKEKPNAV
jgi:acyl-coenzyme A synthetase/AMP-(fatty) acid ligase/acyl carrier protein